MCPPLLAHFNDDLPAIVHTDASGVGLGAVLIQTDEKGMERVVAYASRKLTAEERKCHSSETECLAVVWATRKFHPYLHGRFFTVLTDNIALRSLQSKSNLSAKLTRWALELQEFTFQVKYRPGKTNGDADFLSRLPEYQISNISRQDLLQAQQECPRIQLLAQNIGQGSPYFIQAGLLYQRGKVGQNHRLVVPTKLQRDIIKFCHSDNSAGHLGVHKTCHRETLLHIWAF
jgi:hypothetical protein